MTQQVLDRNLTRITKSSKKKKKIVKVCLHYSKALRISLQFDEFFFDKKNQILISRGFEIFTKHLSGYTIAMHLLTSNSSVNCEQNAF